MRAKLGRKTRLEFCVQIFTSVCSTDLPFSMAREPQLDAFSEGSRKELKSWGGNGDKGGRERDRKTEIEAERQR